MLNDPVQNAAVTLAAPVLLAFNAINNLFGVGSSSMMSRALGRKDYETVWRSSAFGFYCALICGALFSLACTVFQSPLLTILGADSVTTEATAAYMNWTVSFGAVPAILNVVLAYLVRSEGAALHASIGTMSGCILNIILDPFFILPWGLNMGAGGAGLATFLSNCVACLYFFVLLFVKRGRTYVCINPKKFVLKKDIVTGVCAVGIPASIQNLLNVTGMTILNNFTSAYGADAVAAMGICQKIYMVPMYVSQGISQGIMPLISYNYSSGNVPRMKHTISFSRKAALTIIISVAALFFLFPGTFVEMFMKNETIIEYGSHLLRGFCLGLPFLSIDFLAVGVSRQSAWDANLSCLRSFVRLFWKFQHCLSSMLYSVYMVCATHSLPLRSSSQSLLFWFSKSCSVVWKQKGLACKPHQKNNFLNIKKRQIINDLSLFVLIKHWLTY